MAADWTAKFLFGVQTGNDLQTFIDKVNDENVQFMSFQVSNYRS